MSRFAPVHLPADRQLDGRCSQTLLRHYSMCPRSGYLYAAFKGEASTREMQRGKAIHAVQERAVRLLIEQDEPVPPPDLVKVIVNEVLAEIPVPFEEHDFIRESCYRLASEMAINPRAVVACESLFALEVGGYQVRCRIDYAELVEDGAAAVVWDLKSSRSAPGFEQVARKRPDGTLAAANFQMILYALALADGVPVREETVDGERVETLEPFPLAARAQEFRLSFVFPGIEDREGRMLRRALSLTRAELAEYRESLVGLLRRLARSEETGDWPAIVSDDACAICPAKKLCPIPAALNDHRGTINTPGECAEAFERAEVEKKINAAKQKERRAFVKANGPVRFGGGMVAEIGQSSSEKIADKDGFMAAVERAVRYGEPLERHRFVKVVDSFPLVVRALTVEELAESEGSDESDGDDGRGGGDADERWGDNPPY